MILGQIRKSMIEKSRTKNLIMGFFILLIVSALVVILNINIGSVVASGSSHSSTILFSIRMPRIVSAFLIGGALSLSGYLLQTFFANPIAGPYVLGVSSGAKLVTALMMVYMTEKAIHFGSTMMIAAAFLGSLISMGFILLINRRVKNMSMLVIGGVMIGYICSAVTDIVVTFADDSNIVNLHNWSLGSFSGMTWDSVKVIAVVTITGFVLCMFFSKPMDAFQYGEGYAESVGVRVNLFRVALILLSSLLSAVATAFAGPISFVGVAVPHLMRGLFKTSKPQILLPACFVGGGAFCLFADLLARTLFAPTELSISSVTAIFGAPIVIYLMVRKRGR